MGSFLSTIYHSYISLCFRRILNLDGRVHLPDVEKGKSQDTSIVPKKKQRALLVGICYARNKSDTWWPLETPHQDVDQFWNLLVGEYFSSASPSNRA